METCAVIDSALTLYVFFVSQRLKCAVEKCATFLARFAKSLGKTDLNYFCTRNMVRLKRMCIKGT